MQTDQNAEREKWDRLAEDWSGEIRYHERDLSGELADLLQTLDPPVARILEAGCGPGLTSICLAEKGFETDFLDFSEPTLKAAEENWRKLASDSNVQPRFHHADLLKTSLEELGTEAYDCVFNAGVLEHYEDDQIVALLQGMARLSGQYVLALVPNSRCIAYRWWRWYHMRAGTWPYGKETPRATLSNLMCRAGLTPVCEMPVAHAWTVEFIDKMSEVADEFAQWFSEDDLPDELTCYLVCSVARVGGDGGKRDQRNESEALSAGLQQRWIERLHTEQRWLRLSWLEEQRALNKNIETQKREFEAASDALRAEHEQKTGEATRERNVLQEQLRVDQEALAAERKMRQSAEQRVAQAKVDHEALQQRREALRAENEQKKQQIRDLEGRVAELGGRLGEIEGSSGYRNLQRLKRVRDKFLWLSATHECRPMIGSLIEAVFGWFWRLVLGRRMGAALDARNQDPYFYHHTLRIFTPDPKPWQSRKYLTVDTRQGPGRRVAVSLIATVYNEADNIRGWMQCIGRQSRLPDEMIIVDGGSDDATVDILRQEASKLGLPVEVLVEPGCNIARGRNTAIRRAANEFIATADAGCSLTEQWLEHLVAPFEHDETVDAVIGWFEIDPDASDWTKHNTWLFFPKLETVDPKAFLPSSRSFALRKTLALKIGGYPEHLTRWGEDTLFCLNLTGVGAKWAFAPEAVAYWQGPANWKALLRNKYHYAIGDGEARVYLGANGSNARAMLTLVLLVCITLGLAGAGLVSTPVLWGSVVASAVTLLYFWRVGVTKWALAGRANWGASHGRPYKPIVKCWLTAAATTLGTLKGLWRSRGVVLRRVLDPDAQTVVFPPAHEWFWMKQRPTQLAEAFARQGFQVVFCPNNYAERIYGGLLKVDDRIVLCNDLGCIRQLKHRIVYSAAAHHFISHKRLLRRSGRVIYDMIDDNKITSSTERDVRAAVRTADVTCVTARRLDQYVRKLGGKDPLVVPNAVRYDDWRPRGRAAPPDLARIIEGGRTVIGYVGALSYWFDWKLVAAVARMRPDDRIVLIGPVLGSAAQTALSALPRNVHHLGTKDYAELPAYVENFTAATIPFLINEVTLCTNPVKLFEYAAAEVPIVTTDLPECRAFDIVRIAHTPEEFNAHLDRAAADRQDPHSRDALRKLALANTWDQRANAILRRLQVAGPCLPDSQQRDEREAPPRSDDSRNEAEAFNRRLCEKSDEIDREPLETVTARVDQSGSGQTNDMEAPPSFKDFRKEAKILNRRLYEHSANMNPELLETVTAQIDQFSRELNYEDEWRAGWHEHRYRLAATLAALKPLLKDGASALDLGGLSVTTLLLKKHFPGIRWRNADWDLRRPWQCEADSLDAIIAMEVFEHLNDLPDDLNDTFNQTGICGCLDQAYRALRPEGLLFATTPNATSIVCVGHILFGNPGMFFPKHIREYCKQELVDLAQQAGFRVESIYSVHCLTIDTGVDYTPIFQLLLANRDPVEDRGDDWFMVLQKP